MPIYTSSQFDLRAQLPLRKYTVVSTVNARDNIPTINRYDGFITYVAATNMNYQLQGGITNSDWVAIVSDGTEKYLSAVTVNSINDVDFTIEGGTDILGIDFGHTHSHTELTDIGTNTHAAIDTHIADSTIHFDDLSSFTTDDLTEGALNFYSRWEFIQDSGGIYYNDANVAVGRVTADYKFDVNGDIRATENLYIGTTTAPTVDTGTLNALVWDNITGEVKQRAISEGTDMVYPPAGIAVSTGSAWGTSIVDNSSSWNDAYDHSILVTGNPHAVTFSQLGGNPSDVITAGTNLSWDGNTLNASGGSSITFGSENEIPTVNSTTDGYDYSAQLSWNGTVLTMYNTAFGNNYNNIVIGRGAVGGSLTSAYSNVIIGDTIAINFRAGDQNVLIGKQVASSATDINNTVAIGTESAQAMTTQDNNIFLGTCSGKYETGGNKLFIDSLDRTNETTARVSSLIYGEFNETPSSQFLRINGKLQLGVTPAIDTGTLNALVWDNITGEVKQRAISEGTDMVYPPAGIAVSNGTGWDTSITPSTGYLYYDGSTFSWESVSSSLWSQNGSDIYYNGNVGIGDFSSTSPSEALDVAGNIVLGDGKSTRSSLVFRRCSDTGSGQISYYEGASDNYMRYYCEANHAHSFYNGRGVALLHILDDGGATRIGINDVTSPAYELDIAGSQRITSDLYVEGSVGVGTSSPQTQLQIGDNTGSEKLLLFGSNSNTTSSEILFGDNTSGASPYYYGMGIRFDSANNYLSIDDNIVANTSLMVIERDTGNVGIGTSSPSYKLDVNGVGHFSEGRYPADQFYETSKSGTTANDFFDQFEVLVPNVGDRRIITGGLDKSPFLLTPKWLITAWMYRLDSNTIRIYGTFGNGGTVGYIDIEDNDTTHYVMGAIAV